MSMLLSLACKTDETKEHSCYNLIDILNLCCAIADVQLHTFVSTKCNTFI